VLCCAVLCPVCLVSCAVLEARDKFLKPGGALYPSQARMFLAPIRTNASAQRTNDFQVCVEGSLSLTLCVRVCARVWLRGRWNTPAASSGQLRAVTTHSAASMPPCLLTHTCHPPTHTRARTELDVRLV
jgi:succinate dehydrogenase/fumarate reductase-like Fe-S protein